MWFRSLFDALVARSSRTSVSRIRRVPRLRPLLEILEDRTLLSTYTVNALTDSGTGSGLTGDLRYCVTHATSGNDTIDFAAGLSGTINLQSALPTLNASVAIQGPGAKVITVDGGTSPEYGFNVDGGAQVQITGLTMYYSVSDIKAGSATISNCTFSDAGLLTDQYTVHTGTALTVSNCTLNGGGIDNFENGAALTVTNCTISGGVDNAYGSATISNCTLSGGSIGNGASNHGSATISISNCTLSDGTIHNFASAYNSSSATISNCTLSGSNIVNDALASATISYSTISGDISEGASYGGAPPDAVGAINNAGNLTINNCTLSGNKVVGGPAYDVTSQSGGFTYSGGNGMGGAIYNSAGTLTINSSTIVNNEAIGGSTASLSTAGNGMGGGLYIAGGTVSINNSTFADNQAIGGAGPHLGPGTAFGGGIYNAVGPSALQMHDTILADNTANVGPDLNGGLTSLGYNLIGKTAGGSGYAASDLVNVNPQLGPLQNNGGPTQTMALLAGSPAINAGDNTNAPAYDQRGPGFARIVGGTIDIGAFEVQNTSNQASSLAVTGFPSTITAGNSGSFTVTALNADGSTDTNYTGTVHFTSSDPLAVLPASYTFSTADAGVHTFSATLKTAGTQSITATDTTTGSVTGSDTGITVIPAAASQLDFGQQPSTTTAGQTISPAVTVDVEDPYGNRVTSDSSTVTVTLSSGTFASGSATVSAAASSGVATFSALTIDRAGSYTLKATDGTLASATSGTFSIQPAAASTLSVTGFPTSTTAGVAHTFTVTLRDPYGNVATGYTGTVHFTSSDHKAVLPASYTFTAADAGIHTFSATLKTAGTQSITATDTTATSLKGTEGGIKVNPAAASKFVLTAPASVSAGAPFSLTVTVEDAYGNVVVGYTGTLHFSSTDSQATLPANYTFTTANAGVHTFPGLVLRKKGYQTISVTDTHNSALKGSAIVDVL